MATPVVVVASGGLPVTISDTFGIPVEEAANGFGIPVTIVNSGGIAVTGLTTVVVVAAGGGMPNGTVNVPGARTSFIGDIAFVMGNDASDLVPRFDNFYLDATALTQSGGGTITIAKCAILNAGKSVNVPVTFNGSRSIVLASRAEDIHADAILPASFSLSQFSRDEVYYIRLAGSYSIAGFNLPAGANTDATGTSFHTCTAVNLDTSQVDATGTYTTPTSGVSSSMGFGPTGMFGHAVHDDYLAVIGIGASFMDGFNDLDTGVLTGRGTLMRAALDNGSASTTIAVMRCSRGGTGIYQALSNPQILAAMRYANVCVNDYGGNDVGDGQTPTQIQNNLTASWSAARARGIDKIVAMKMNPRTNSTDNWTTAVNQTAVANFGVGGNAETVNTFLTSALSLGLINGLFTTDAWRDSGGAGDYWKILSDGVTANKWTLDGRHPNTDGYAQKMAPELRTILLGLFASGALTWSTDRMLWGSDRIKWG